MVNKKIFKASVLFLGVGCNRQESDFGMKYEECNGHDNLCEYDELRRIILGSNLEKKAKRTLISPESEDILLWFFCKYLLYSSTKEDHKESVSKFLKRPKGDRFIKLYNKQIEEAEKKKEEEKQKAKEEQEKEARKKEVKSKKNKLKRQKRKAKIEELTSIVPSSEGNDTVHNLEEKEEKKRVSSFDSETFLNGFEENKAGYNRTSSFNMKKKEEGAINEINEIGTEKDNKEKSINLELSRKSSKSDLRKFINEERKKRSGSVSFGRNNQIIFKTENGISQFHPEHGASKRKRSTSIHFSKATNKKSGSLEK